jgi:hypothetical protein
MKGHHRHIKANTFIHGNHHSILCIHLFYSRLEQSNIKVSFILHSYLGFRLWFLVFGGALAAWHSLLLLLIVVHLSPTDLFLSFMDINIISFQWRKSKVMITSTGVIQQLVTKYSLENNAISANICVHPLMLVFLNYVPLPFI